MRLSYIALAARGCFFISMYDGSGYGSGYGDGNGSGIDDGNGSGIDDCPFSYQPKEKTI